MARAVREFVRLIRDLQKKIAGEGRRRFFFALGSWIAYGERGGAGALVVAGVVVLFVPKSTVGAVSDPGAAS